MSVTAETFHPDMSPLNEEAPANMERILVAEETSHVDTSPSNFTAE